MHPTLSIIAGASFNTKPQWKHPVLVSNKTFFPSQLVVHEAGAIWLNMIY